MWKKAVLKCIINESFLANNHNGTQSTTVILINIFKHVPVKKRRRKNYISAFLPPDVGAAACHSFWSHHTMEYRSPGL